MLPAVATVCGGIFTLIVGNEPGSETVADFEIGVDCGAVDCGAVDCDVIDCDIVDCCAADCGVDDSEVVGCAVVSCAVVSSAVVSCGLGVGGKIELAGAGASSPLTCRISPALSGAGASWDRRPWMVSRAHICGPKPDEPS